jgi:T-complex protein 1 subunit delta
LVEEASTSGAKFVKVTGIKHSSKTTSIVVRGANHLVLEEADRSLHDALCVIRCLVKNK